MVSEVKKNSYIEVLQLIISFLFPAFSAGIYFSKSEDRDFVKRSMRLSIIGFAFELLVFIVLMILGYSSTITISTRVIAFYFFILLVIQSAGTLIWFQHIYINDKEKTENKFYKYSKLILIIITVIASVIVVYELDAVIELVPQGFSLNGGFHFVYARDVEQPLIAFYALFILGGAGVAYIVATNKAAEYGYARNIFETLLLIALPMGILGARIWWVISEWNRELAYDQTLHGILNFRDGGLAVQGGVLLGAFSGIWYVIEKKREIPILRATDVIIPGILLAQAIGRLGNFTNVEVYGAQADPAAWSFLPNIIINQFVLTKGQFYVPLFLIEALFNLCGYFVITYGVTKLFKKFIKEGDVTACYFIWYGLVRIVMEPLRDSKFIMGTSLQMSLCFILLGIAVIVINHLMRYLIENNKLPSGEWKEKYLTWIRSKSEFLRFLLALPLVDGIFYGLYRIAKGHYFSGIVWVVFGAVIGWIFDLVSLFLRKPLVMSKPYV